MAAQGIYIHGYLPSERSTGIYRSESWPFRRASMTIFVFSAFPHPISTTVTGGVKCSKIS